MQDKVVSLVSRVTRLNEDDLRARADEAGLWDSFAHVELVIVLEEAFNVSFAPEEIAEMKTLNKIVDSIQKKAAV